METDVLRRDAWRSLRPAGAVERLTTSATGWDGGTSLADAAIDAGAGVLLIIDQAQPSSAACAITALYCNTDATSVVSGAANDLDWMQRCAAIRDAMVTLRPSVGDAAALLSHDPELAVWVAAIVKAAARRTPVVIVGAVPHIAALAAQRLTSASSAWVFSALQDSSAPTTLALKRLALTPWATTAWLPADEHAERIARALVSDLD